MSKRDGAARAVEDPTSCSNALSRRRVLALGNSTADEGVIAAATGNLGIVYRTRGDLTQAEQMYTKALTLNDQLGRKKGMAILHGNLGVLEKERGNIAAVCAHWRKAVELFRANGMPHMVEKHEALMREAGCSEE